MANRRMIASDLFEDEFVGNLDYFGRLLWIGLFSTVADDQGRMIDSAALIRSKVFLYDSVEDRQVESILQKVKDAGKIARYVAGNKHLIQIVKWWEYQTPAWASPSKYPAPQGWQDRAKYHAPGNKIITANWDKIGGYVANYVPGQDRPIEEGDVKGDGDGEGKGDGDDKAASDPFSIVQSWCEIHTGRLATPGDTDAINELLREGVIEQDIQLAVAWFADNKKVIHNIAQTKGSVLYQKGKRIQAATAASTPKGGNGHARQPAERDYTNTLRLIEEAQARKAAMEEPEEA